VASGATTVTLAPVSSSAAIFRSADTVGRLLANHLNKKWGVPINVVNKPGGQAIPGTLEVYQASPDGYTMLGDGNPTTSIMSVIQKDLPFKIMDRSFIAVATISIGIFCVPSSSPFKSIKDVEIEAKKNPGNF
jgi:tripartite-type tricarboxylate transporter receptor subunit TctC